MTSVIRAVGLSKQYRLGQREPYGRLSEALSRLAARTIRGARHGSHEDQFIWALKDVAFDVREGEVVGIVGRNGAGKSTLLKILSRITEPTRGTVEIRGRVGSLLEVGTGFHPELTGRENVYLNGAILGMSREEIGNKFDEIVAFAEVEKFLDTPVKHYSTGMYLRLAFAVAAHLEPEILLVDEVLAVGDALFQKKCLGKMGSLSRGGRTVLFVSHQLNAVKALCTRALWLSHGSIAEDGEPGAVISRYLLRDGVVSDWRSHGEASPLRNEFFNPVRLAVLDRSLKPLAAPVSAATEVGILIEGEILSPNAALTVGFALYAAGGELLFWSLQTDVHPDRWPRLSRGPNRLIAWIPAHLLNEGDYTAELIVSLHHKQWLSQPGVNAPGVSFSVRGGLSESPHWMSPRPGLLAPILPFERLDG